VLTYNPDTSAVEWVYGCTLYQVLQVASGPVLAFDWTRAHA
jgi:hypothetical protein